MADPVADVIASDYKKPFVFFMAAVSIVVAVILGLSKIEIMVADHEKRLVKIEEKLGSMGDVLAEIRSDVKVLRAQSERR